MRTLFLFFATVAWALNVFAASDEAQLSLNDALKIARAQNPEIAAARDEWEMARAKIPAAKTWPDPEIGIEYWGFPRSSLNVTRANERWLDVAQTIPFPGKLTLKGNAAKHEARREEELYRSMERDVLTQVKEAYYALFYAEHASRIAGDNVDNMRRFANISNSKYGVGKASQSDVLRAQVELSRLQNMAITALQEEETARAKLNSLLDRHPETQIKAQETPPLKSIGYSYDDLEKMALENRPEVVAASHHVNHMQAEVAAMRADYLPDTTIQFTRRQVEGQESDNIAMFRFTLPFVWAWRQGALVRSTDFERQHAYAKLRSERTATRYELKASLVRVETARRQVDLYKTTVLPQSDQAVRVAERAYQSDRASFLDLLDSARASIEFQLDYYKSLADYGASLARLERVVGVDFLTGSEQPQKEENSHE
jgi:outer membrane protein TolC